MKKQLTCERKIEKELADRMEEIYRALELFEEGEETTWDGKGCQDLQEKISSHDKRGTVYICLSTGDPEDGFEFDIDLTDKRITGARYIFKKQFDVAQIELNSRELIKVLLCYGLDYATLIG